MRIVQNENLITIPIDALWVLLACGNNFVWLALNKEVNIAYMEVDANYLFVVHARIELTIKFTN
jgi:hypothetical protein